MIKAGIIGKEQSQSAHLFRILINHPDVVVKFIADDTHAGLAVSDVHPELTGDTDLRFSSNSEIETSKLDVVFCCMNSDEAREFMAKELPEELRIIDLSGTFRSENSENGFVYGLPELYRKAMVRGARRVSIPHPTAISMELALLPLAKEHLLTSQINVVSVSHTPTQQIERPTLSYRNTDEVVATIREFQKGFCAPILFTHVKGNGRGVVTRLYTEANVTLQKAYELFEDYYDDHNFVFMTHTLPHADDIEGTNKCLIHIDKEGDRLVVTSLLDSGIKGTVGNAVHAMNLLFGLHERTGLSFLKL